MSKSPIASRSLLTLRAKAGTYPFGNGKMKYLAGGDSLISTLIKLKKIETKIDI